MSYCNFPKITAAEYKRLRTKIYDGKFGHRKTLPNSPDEHYECFVNLTVDGVDVLLGESTTVFRSSGKKSRTVFFEREGKTFVVAPSKGFHKIHSDGWEIFDVNDLLPKDFATRVLNA